MVKQYQVFPRLGRQVEDTALFTFRRRPVRPARRSKEVEIGERLQSLVWSRGSLGDPKPFRFSPLFSGLKSIVPCYCTCVSSLRLTLRVAIIQRQIWNHTCFRNSSTNHYSWGCTYDFRSSITTFHFTVSSCPWPMKLHILFGLSWLMRYMISGKFGQPSTFGSS